ncbi:MAG: hypothetical protein H6Q73_2517 [Firmicutes bacterium]|nr:hypothetical protein [Bacillota bacterium]
MRRYFPLFLMSFFLVIITVVGTNLLADAGKENPDTKKHIVVYCTLPVEQIAVLTQEYEKNSGIVVDLVPLSDADLLTRLAVESDAPRADVVLANSETLKQAVKLKALAAYDSEVTDVIPDRFRDSKNQWVGVWYDPIVFAINKDFLKKLPRAPQKWDDLASNNNQYRLVITDFLAADASVNIFNTLVAVKGENDAMAYLAKLHPKIVQYAKFLSTPPRMAGLAEADIAIAVQSETLRYVHDGFPLELIHPEDGTAYLLTGVGLAVGAPHSVEAKPFIDWLLQNQAQTVLYDNRFYMVPTNADTVVYKKLAGKENNKPIPLFEYEDKLNAAEKAKLLDKWVQTVRLSPR